MLSLAQTTELLAQSHKLSPRQFALISRLHKENLAKARKLPGRNCTAELIEAPGRGDIRYNPAKADKYSKSRLPGTTKLVAKAIDPNTGEYRTFSTRQLAALRLALANGKTQAQAIKLARALPA